MLKRFECICGKYNDVAIPDRVKQIVTCWSCKEKWIVHKTFVTNRDGFRCDLKVSHDV